jgi:hypothetical protein
VSAEDLDGADLVLVDYDLADWTAKENALALPPNGLALAGVMRQRIDGLFGGVPRGVALYSGEVERISANLPMEVRSYVVARLNNLEWVFEKGTDDAAPGVVSFASAVAALPAVWPEGSQAVSALHELLGLTEDSPFFTTAAEDVAACHPPIHELSTATHALAILRWVAQRILPYPAFLMDKWGLSARLQIDPAQLDSALEGTQLGAELQDVSYIGILSDLFGRHWWRAGVDNLIFSWTQGAGGASQIRSAIEDRADGVSFVEGDLVPVIDDSYRPIGIAPVETAVRVLPDDWPAFADEAWAEAAVVGESARLRGLVLPADQGKLA